MRYLPTIDPHRPEAGPVPTYCAVCAHSLTDAPSVELGIGPDCRRQHGYDRPDGAADQQRADGEIARAIAIDERLANLRTRLLSDDPRIWKRVLVRQIAVSQRGTAAAHLTAALHAVGWVQLAAAIAKRLGSAVIEQEGNVLLLRARRTPTLVAELRKVPGRMWHGGRGVNVVPAAQGPALWTLLKRALPIGTIVVGPRRMTVIGRVA